MKGDFTRNTFDPAKHFSRVLMQQGRVTLDSDFNEQAAILLHYLRTLVTDLIGPASGPIHQCGFEIFCGASGLPVGDFHIGAGRYYVDGILCENETMVSYRLQPDPPVLEQLSAGEFYLVYLDVWERHICALEDDSIREVALGGPDTASRVRVVWQVKLKPLGTASATCAAAIRKLQDGILPMLRAGVKSEEDSTNPCVLPPEARYRGAANQLYRVEIHRGSNIPEGSPQKPTFKWSRENGSVVFPIEKLATDSKADTVTLTLRSLGPENRFGLTEGDWVEIVDDDYVLQNRAEKLLQVQAIHRDDLTVTLSGNLAPNVGQSTKHPLLRRWDHKANASSLADDNALLVPTANTWYELEDGLQVRGHPIRRHLSHGRLLVDSGADRAGRSRGGVAAGGAAAAWHRAPLRASGHRLGR